MQVMGHKRFFADNHFADTSSLTCLFIERLFAITNPNGMLH